MLVAQAGGNSTGLDDDREGLAARFIRGAPMPQDGAWEEVRITRPIDEFAVTGRRRMLIFSSGASAR
jgi:hypothetical protein